MSDETIVIVRVAARDVQRALGILRQDDGGAAVTFVVQAPPAPTLLTPQETREVLPIERLVPEAERIAGELSLSKAARRLPLLARLRHSERLLQRVHRHLAEAGRARQQSVLAADWLLDNAYVIQGHIDDIYRNLPRRFFKRLPLLGDGPYRGLPRVYALAAELIACSDGRIETEIISKFVHALQTRTPLTMAELWALPLLLRLRLIERLSVLASAVEQRQCERELAEFWANRLRTARRRDPERLLDLLALMAREEPLPSVHLADELLDQLYDEETTLASARVWLERQFGAGFADAFAHEQRRQTAEQIALTNAVLSLRWLAQTDWRTLFEALNGVDAVLAQDPAAIYTQMDFATRDRYRHAVEEIAQRSTGDEIQIARAALALTQVHNDDLLGHVGYYLIDMGRAVLEDAVHFRPSAGMTARRFLRRHTTGIYLGTLTAMSLAVVAALAAAAFTHGESLPIVIVLSVLALLPASELAVQVTNYLVTRAVAPRLLPRLYFGAGIPADYKTLVVIPTMLSTPDAILREVERLERRYLANPDAQLRFALVSDYHDAPALSMPEDMEYLEVAVRATESLNARYGDGRFFLLHREREWNAGEKCWMGWERKRGKLEQLNQYLLGSTQPEITSMLRSGDAQELQGIRFVITLDADTQLPPESARRMIETLAHPLNLPRLAADRRSVTRGYTLLQPRVSTSLPSATATLFSLLFTASKGIDPYANAVSDIYQDLFGDGSYHGKGLYDLHAFHTLLDRRFPSSHLLSHDLLEGAHARVGYASDIELFDQFPSDYAGFAHRQHRWIRGDWQIIDWLRKRVPAADGAYQTTILPLMQRWRIFDNLRRSLLPIASLALLLISWMFSAEIFLWSAFVVMVMWLPAFVALIDRLTRAPLMDRQAWQDVVEGFARVSVFIALLPHQAYLAADAIARVAYRRMISKKRLLEWETAQQTQSRGARRRSQFIQRLTWITWVSAGAGLIAAPAWPHGGVLVYFLTLAWASAPALVLLLNWRVRERSARNLTDDECLWLRGVTRETWHFFAKFVGTPSNFLPPDNFQAALRTEVAERTSPTNIGLYLLSVLAARDLGYITTAAVIERIGATLDTLDKLDRYEGHFFNWYHTGSLQALHPRYVSTVDSANLLATLYALEQGFYDLLAGPALGTEIFAGLSDTYQHVQETSEKTPAEFDTKQAPNAALTLEEIVRRVRSARRLAQAQTSADESADDTGHAYWAAQFAAEVQQWNDNLDVCFRWAEVLADPPGGLHLLSQDAHAWRRQALADAPSLKSLATGDVRGLMSLIALTYRKDDEELPQELRIWLAELADAGAEAQIYADVQLERGAALIRRIQAFAEAMRLSFLYHPERRLFAIGYNVDERRMDNSFYDLLASEARLASFLAVARNEVPVQHWWALGRPFGMAYRRRVLLSWSGTLFEYLMPLLLTRRYRNSLLDDACRAAVACQIDYGNRRGIPWGISEAAHSALDANKIYQYRAFGVPGLGLKRGLEEDLVVAPYASALALAVDAPAAVRNLKRLSALRKPSQPEAAYGYYESIDYTRQQGPEGSRGVIVYAYMAHHQGMLLLAINNVLHDNIMPRRFHAHPRVRAVESLLYERVPLAPAMAKDYVRDAPLARLSALPSAAVEQAVDFDTAAPRTHLLSNDELSVMITHSGGGYTRWKDIDITRWRADTTCDAWGSYIYVKDDDSGERWSCAYQPVQSRGKGLSVQFTADKAEFQRRGVSVDTVMEVIVSPEDNAEIRRVTFTNRTARARTLAITSYSELALAPHNADRAHPAFSKLFIYTEALPDINALIAWRRPRGGDDEIFAGHLITPCPAEFRYETNRLRFIGRGQAPVQPAAMHEELSNSAGAVLDPIFSLRQRYALAPGERFNVSVVTVCASTRAEVIALLEKYHDPSAAERAFEMAWTHAQIALRHLRITPEEARLFQQLAAYVLYPQARLRPPPERLRRNTLGQSGLWTYGISGDLPIVIITIEDMEDIDVVRQLLLAHTYWRIRGLQVDVLILNEEPVSYHQPLGEQLQRLMLAHGYSTGADQPGSVYLLPAHGVPERDLTLLLAAARIVLVAARGPLLRQLATPAPLTSLPPRLSANRALKEPLSAPLPFMELPYFNGYGGFTTDGREYAVYLGPDVHTPAPWSNVIANAGFGTLVTESGGGFSWCGNSQSNRLTPWSNDAVRDRAADVLYIRDEHSGKYWTPTPLPIRELDSYRTRHGQGYSVFEHNSHGIEQELVITVPVDAGGGAPLRIQRLRLRNGSSYRRKLSITAYCEWVLGGDREDTQMHIVTQWDQDSRALFARNAYHADYSARVAFLHMTPGAASYSADRTEFIGRNGSLRTPAALRRAGLSGHVGAGLDPCAAVQTIVELDPGQQTEIVCLLGQASDETEARAYVRRYAHPAAAQQAVHATSGWWDQVLNALTVKTPDLALDFMLNRWLLYQTLSCRVWARSGFYQSGGAYGFRDQLQDVMALVHAAPDIARAHIIRAAAHQFVEGDVQHWWHEPSMAGVRTRISDDLLWLPYVTAYYVRVSGDTTVLDEHAPFLVGRLLEDHEHEAYFVPTRSSYTEPLREHCIRAIAKGDTRGAHDLPLMGGGDWNDGMNRVGAEGRGESVWLAWFLVAVLNDMADVLKQDEDAALAADYRRQARELTASIEANAWDGAWYRRAYFDDGTPLGSAQNEEAKIDSIAQSWAVIAGTADEARADTALRSAHDHLLRLQERMVLLFTPPFRDAVPDPGYIKSYPPGVRENGGQYTHAALWLALAYARRGDGDQATAVLNMLNPVTHALTAAAVERYRVEPYCVAADVYALPDAVGHGGWTWYTGSAAWMYRVWIEEVLGLQRRGETLRIHPCLSSEWPGFSVHYRYGSAVYDIAVQNPHGMNGGVDSLDVDGVVVTGNTFTLQDDGGRHSVTAILAVASSAARTRA